MGALPWNNPQLFLHMAHNDNCLTSFMTVRWESTAGVMCRESCVSAMTPESVRDNWDKICDFTDSQHLESNAEATGNIVGVSSYLPVSICSVSQARLLFPCLFCFFYSFILIVLTCITPFGNSHTGFVHSYILQLKCVLPDDSHTRETTVVQYQAFRS